ncbi:MAG: hypothetical protein IJA26_00300 [Clostridia bacterium]|nr:hypothetical protein [Clostridia bacterium]
MKKKFSHEQLKYRFDWLLSHGPMAMIGLLFCLTLTIVCIIALIAFFVSDEGGFVYQIWTSFMHTLDAGTLAGNPTDNIAYIVLMTLATLCGMFITSLLIGIVASGVENKFNELRKGRSVVQESNHTVIIGFNDNTYSLLSELIEANANHKDSRIVVLGENDKQEMEELIAARIPNTKTTRIVCRSGVLHEAFSLKRP